jgi:hypothetical protein
MTEQMPPEPPSRTAHLLALAIVLLLGLVLLVAIFFQG